MSLEWVGSSLRCTWEQSCDGEGNYWSRYNELRLQATRSRGLLEPFFEFLFFGSLFSGRVYTAVPLASVLVKGSSIGNLLRVKLDTELRCHIANPPCVSGVYPLPWDVSWSIIFSFDEPIPKHFWRACKFDFDGLHPLRRLYEYIQKDARRSKRTMLLLSGTTVNRRTLLAPSFFFPFPPGLLCYL